MDVHRINTGGGTPLSMTTAKVLVVDDEQDLCEILRFNLESEGFEVQTCEDAEEALALMSGETHWHPDLILLDLMM